MLRAPFMRHRFGGIYCPRLSAEQIETIVRVTNILGEED
jgi:hypothetical protein